MVKILIGGSPCTHWSIAQKNNRETEAEGLGWELFRNYLIAKEKFKPDFFLYENNKSAAQPIKDQISLELGVPLQYINSALVSAQNRQRFYAHNIPNVPIPEDRGILLKDILESGVQWQEKSYALTTRCMGAIPEDTLKRHRHTMVAEPVRIGKVEGSQGGQGDRIYSCDGKSVCQSANGGGRGAKTGLYACPVDAEAEMCDFVEGKLDKLVDKYGALPKMFNPHNLKEIADKSPTVTAQASSITKSSTILRFEATDKPIYEVRNGLITIKGKQYPIKLADGFYIIRKLTPIECERLQTMPDNYTAGISNSQRYKCLGNGWTAEVIIHILKHMNIPLDEEIQVLSMYDGIGTGRYCLDKMGFKNVKYHAYEIDKYAMQIAMSNYTDIIQHGDAFQVREEDWTL